MPIQASVGPKQKNDPSDVFEVQRLINAWAQSSLVPETGKFDQATSAGVIRFQREVVGLLAPDGTVEPASATWLALDSNGGKNSQTARLEEALLAFEADAIAFADRFITDLNLRANYVREAMRFSTEIRNQVASGVFTAEQGAKRAVDMRNALLEAARLRSSDIGRALAQAEKATGITFDQLLERYASKLFRQPFSNLSPGQQDAVFEEIVRAAGRPNPRFTALAQDLGRVGKGLFIVSLAFAAYQIGVSDQPGRESVRQGVGIGAGIGGSIAGGALAGLACGPGAPVCVGIGAVIGGIAFAIGADVTFNWLWH